MEQEMQCRQAKRQQHGMIAVLYLKMARFVTTVIFNSDKEKEYATSEIKRK